MSGAERIAKVLWESGVRLAFVFPGGTVSRLLAAMRDVGIRLIVCVNEAAAGHAAQGYFRASGQLGVVVVTSGPGVTNALTPLADAYYDGDQVLFLCGQVATDQMGRGTRQDGFQWTPTVRLCQSISLVAVEPNDAPWRAVLDAIPLLAGGPGVISIPADLLL